MPPGGKFQHHKKTLVLLCVFYEYEAKNDSVRFCTKEEWKSYIYDEYYQYNNSSC